MKSLIFLFTLSVSIYLHPQDKIIMTNPPAEVHNEEEIYAKENLLKSALLIVDIQNDYFPGGKNELVGGIEAANKAKQLLNQFRNLSLPVIHIQHISTRPTAKFFLPETEGAEIHNLVKPLEAETVIVKHSPNSFKGTSLLEYLQKHEIKNLIICGMMTHMCIDATTRAAKDFGFNCVLANDACATRDLTFNNKTVPAEFVHLSFLAALNGSYAKVKSVDEIIQDVKEKKDIFK